MSLDEIFSVLARKYTHKGNHPESNYFALIKEIVHHRNQFPDLHDNYQFWEKHLGEVYILVADEIMNNINRPISPVIFGTSGWRGIIGKDINLRSISQVTYAIIDLFQSKASQETLWQALGVSSCAEAKRRGCVLGHDNRFGNELLARRVAEILTGHGFQVYYAGEATTGTLSAALLELQAAFSINLTPSHNPLEYGGCKFNAADGGPASPIITNQITTRTQEFINSRYCPDITADNKLCREITALNYWVSLIRKGRSHHKLDYDVIMDAFAQREDFTLVVDSVHGASRGDLPTIFKNIKSANLSFLRTKQEYTFGGIAPEPSANNLHLLEEELAKSTSPLKLGVIMDPDADRIRFTDGETKIDMNQFGAMAYYFLHEVKKINGLVAKTVATSNFVNAIARALHEDVFEPKVGFKEFKPVIDQALVCFEESDGITVIGHTPEKDAYIGLLLAMDMVMSLNKNLGEILHDLQEEYGYYFPAKDGVTVSKKGPELLEILSSLGQYKPGDMLQVGGASKKIEEMINIDGHKFVFSDKSWLMVRPSGTEPKVRFYIEARSIEQKDELIAAAKSLLKDLGLG